MNRDDIARMAREAGLDAKVFQFYGIDEPRIRLDGLHWHGELERFAHLVAAAERDKQTQIADNIESALEDLVSYCNNVDLGHIDEVLAAEDALVAAYRARGEK